MYKGEEHYVCASNTVLSKELKKKDTVNGHFTAVCFFLCGGMLKTIVVEYNTIVGWSK